MTGSNEDLKVGSDRGQHNITQMILPSIQRLWWINPVAEVDLDALLVLAGLMILKDEEKLNNLHILEKEFDYMVREGIINGFRIKGISDTFYPSDLGDPFSCVIQFREPESVRQAKGCCD